MQCPVCKNKKTKGVYSTKDNDKNRVNRRRECQECLTRFSTTESLVFHSIPAYVRERMLRSG